MNLSDVKHRPSLGGRGLILFVAAALAVPLLFAWYTGHIWEDFFITFRHSQNLCDGNGLVYQPGERVHGFTSPLGTLLPALGYWLTGRSSYLAALWLFRVLSALAFAGAGVLLLSALRACGTGKAALLIFALLYLLDVKAVDFSINGMETAFVLLFFGWSIYLLARERPVPWLALGLSWSGLMWTRPDGCVYIAALAIAWLVFPALPRRDLVRGFAKSAAVCAAIYLPWFAWAWSYYGSPVPNTIRAKAGLAADRSPAAVIQEVLRIYPERLGDSFGAVYRTLGPWPVWGTAVALILGAFCALYWLVPTSDRIGRRMSLCFALLTLYLASMPLCYPWYLPPVALCGLFVIARAVSVAVDRSGGWRSLPAVVLAAGVVLVVGERVWLFAMTGQQMKAQQEVIEWGNRAQVGLWLKDHVKPGERVYVECLGYTGYFSEAYMLDYPGLVAPAVVREMRREPHDLPSVGMRLAPDWMVLRPGETRYISRDKEFRKHYIRVKEFDVTDRLGHYADLRGRDYLLFDAAFDVFQRVPDTSATVGNE
jgi:hypothetical protein